jgi:translation elongation factor EF-Tu-like GTPase
MSPAFSFYDELRPAGTGPIRVLARLHVLTAAEGGKQGPFRAVYRPNHNFGLPEDRHFFVGQVEVPKGEWVHPGETREFTISFLNVVGLAEQLTEGRRWRIQEGPRLVAMAELLAILPE